MCVFLGVVLVCLHDVNLGQCVCWWLIITHCGLLKPHCNSPTWKTEVVKSPTTLLSLQTNLKCLARSLLLLFFLYKTGRRESRITHSWCCSFQSVSYSDQEIGEMVVCCFYCLQAERSSIKTFPTRGSTLPAVAKI